MRITKRRNTIQEPGVIAVARVDRRTSAVVSRLQPGEIAVIDHPDLDRTTAQRLIDASPAMVLNLAPFISGRHPARGAGHLLDAGIDLVDGLGAGVHAGLRDGQTVRVHEGRLHVGDEVVATGAVLDRDRLIEQRSAAETHLAAQLITVTHNTTALLRDEEATILHGAGLPRLQVDLRDRDVLVVADGPELADELRGLRPWLKQQDVVVLAEDRVADLLLEAGIRPDVIVVGPTDGGVRCSAAALRGAPDVVLLDGVSSSDREALERMGVAASSYPTRLTAADAALLLAAGGEAQVVVVAGQHADLADLLDRRDGAASAILARLRSGPHLVDARVLPHLWTGRVRAWHLWLVLVAGLLAVLAAVAVTPVGQEWLEPPVHDLFDSIRGLF